MIKGKRREKINLDNYIEQRDNELQKGESRTNYHNVFIESFGVSTDKAVDYIELRTQGRWDDRNEI